MFAALFAAACCAPAADPAPLPDRWLLKLFPDDLPPLPDRVFDVTWYDKHDSRASTLSWILWVEFRRANRLRSAEAVVTRLGDGDPSARWTRGRTSTPQGRRSVPLAVHGPLVEFDRQLYTATLRTGKIGDDIPDREFLHLGSAVEVKGRVWYQAGTRTAEDGKTVTVEEWRLEFKSDPRTAREGVVTVRHHSREITKPDGAVSAADLRFKAEPPNERISARIITLVPSKGKDSDRELLYLLIGHDPETADVIWDHGQHGISLHPDPTDGHKLLSDRPALVQPPAKGPPKPPVRN